MFRASTQHLTVKLRRRNWFLSMVCLPAAMKKLFDDPPDQSAPIGVTVRSGGWPATKEQIQAIEHYLLACSAGITPEIASKQAKALMKIHHDNRRIPD